MAAPGRKRKAYDVICEAYESIDYGGDEKDVGMQANKRFRSIKAALAALQEFHEDHGKDDHVSNEDVINAIGQTGKWEEEICEESHCDRAERGDGFVMRAQILAVE